MTSLQNGRKGRASIAVAGRRVALPAGWLGGLVYSVYSVLVYSV